MGFFSKKEVVKKESEVNDSFTWKDLVGSVCIYIVLNFLGCEIRPGKTPNEFQGHPNHDGTYIRIHWNYEKCQENIFRLLRKIRKNDSNEKKIEIK